MRNHLRVKFLVNEKMTETSENFLNILKSQYEVICVNALGPEGSSDAEEIIVAPSDLWEGFDVKNKIVFGIYQDVSPEKKQYALSKFHDVVSLKDSNNEALLRFENLARRKFQLRFINIGSLNIDLRSMRVNLKNLPLDLTLTEFKILTKLTRDCDCITRGDLSHWVWGEEVISKHTMNTHISNLRGKLKNWECEIQFEKKTDSYRVMERKAPAEAGA